MARANALREQGLFENGVRWPMRAANEKTLIEQLGPIRVLLSARPTGLEPATSGSTVRCSNQLSYGPWRA